LNAKGKKAIASFVNFINDSKISSVTVNCYASQGQTGSEFEIYNQKLSEKRAQAVADYETPIGLDSEKLLPKGFGSKDTLGGNHKT
ncbi:OmpA family protein, partial [Francisella tularensis]|uniref:OmpA family protein n=1 Tax=Francisella tularensis TaxID=263 RepID=UPI002381A5BA